MPPLNSVSLSCDTCVPNEAVLRAQRLMHRNVERNSWRMQQRHRDAIRDSSELVVEGGVQEQKHERRTAGRRQGGKLNRSQGVPVQSAELEPEKRWKLMQTLFRHHDLNRDGSVSTEAFVKILRGVDLYLGEEATLELLRKYECTDKQRAGRSDYILFIKNIRRIIFAGGGQGDQQYSAVHLTAQRLHAATTLSWKVHHGAGGQAGRTNDWLAEPIEDITVLAAVREKASAAWWRWRHSVDFFSTQGQGLRQHIIYQCLRKGEGKGKNMGGGGGRSSSVPLVSRAEEDLDLLRKLVLQEEDGEVLSSDMLQLQLELHRLLMTFQASLSEDELGALSEAHARWKEAGCSWRVFGGVLGGNGEHTVRLGGVSASWKAFLRAILLTAASCDAPTLRDAPPQMTLQKETQVQKFPRRGGNAFKERGKGNMGQSISVPVHIVRHRGTEPAGHTYTHLQLSPPATKIKSPLSPLSPVSPRRGRSGHVVLQLAPLDKLSTIAHGHGVEAADLRMSSAYTGRDASKFARQAELQARSFETARSKVFSLRPTLTNINLGSRANSREGARARPLSSAELELRTEENCDDELFSPPSQWCANAPHTPDLAQQVCAPVEPS